MPGPGALYGTRPGPLLLADCIERQPAYPFCHCGLVPGRGGAAALLRTEGDRAYKRRIGIPLRHLVAQLAPGCDAFGCEGYVDIRIPIPVQYQIGNVVVLMLNNEVCQIHITKILKMLITVHHADRYARFSGLFAINGPNFGPLCTLPAHRVCVLFKKMLYLHS